LDAIVGLNTGLADIGGDGRTGGVIAKFKLLPNCCVKGWTPPKAPICGKVMVLDWPHVDDEFDPSWILDDEFDPNWILDEEFDPNWVLDDEFDPNWVLEGEFVDVDGRRKALRSIDGAIVDDDDDGDDVKAVKEGTIGVCGNREGWVRILRLFSCSAANRFFSSKLNGPV